MEYLYNSFEGLVKVVKELEAKVAELQAQLDALKQGA